MCIIDLKRASETENHLLMDTQAPRAGFHTGFFEKGGKPSDTPHLPGNSAYYCFDS